ncbi:MAG TPA: TraR/DksA C4-type zinc finger protein [Acidimicrobiales bacterium]|nr:TraR/DksA C4-type zinc finger protein [Acidimicrobiales bacterium]
MEHGAAPEPEHAVEPADAAGEVTGSFARETDAFIAEADARLAAIEAAIAAVDDGSYGRCEICGNPVEAPRLAARLSERRCAAHDRAPLAEPRLF